MKHLFAGLFLSVCVSIPASAEEITIVGTGDGVVILKAIGSAFTRANPGVEIDVPESIGSSGGIKAVGNDQFALGRVARKIKEREKQYGLTYLPFARVPTVFFVNREVPVRNLTTDQVNAIYSGAITNWRDVGGSDAGIRVVRREEGDSSLNNLRASFPGFADIQILARSKIATLTDENFAIVANTSRTIGFGPYPGAVAADVHVLSINGHHPTDDGYPSHGVIAVVFKEVNRTGMVGKFIDFLSSPEAQAAIRRANALPY